MHNVVYNVQDDEKEDRPPVSFRGISPIDNVHVCLYSCSPNHHGITNMISFEILIKRLILCRMSHLKSNVRKEG